MRPLKFLTVPLIAAFAAWPWLAPGYIDLNITVLRHEGGGEFWWEDHRTELAYADSGGVLYVHRQVGTAYVRRHHWKTVDEVLNFFDAQMRERGWMARGSADDPAAPETRLLPSANSRYYSRPGAQRPAPYVIVSAWPVGGSVDGFHVALTTANPSLLMHLSRGFD